MNKALEELLVDESFLRWIQGRSQSQEKAYWDAWLQADSKREELVRQAQIFLRLPFDAAEQPDINLELEQLMSAIEGNRVVHKLNSYHSSRQVNGVHWLYKITAIAAVASIIFVLLIFNQPHNAPKEFSSKYKALITAYGEKATLKLTDGTKIYVNAHTTLRYPSRLAEGEPVEVWLDGEAYFDIKNNPNGRRRTFSVHTDDGEIRVLGTQFAVQTHDESTQVVLEEGSVEISLKDSTNKRKETLTMHPGQLSRFGTEGDGIVVRQVNTKVYTSWISNKLIMDDTPLVDLVNRIEQTYGVYVQVENEEMLSHKLSGSLEEYSLAVLLEGLSQILEVEVVHHEGLVVIGKR